MTFESASRTAPASSSIPAPKPDKPAATLAPRTVKLVVTENTAWAITGKCARRSSPSRWRCGPTEPPPIPGSVWARCELVMKRKNGDITMLIHFDIHGDGKVEPMATGKEKLEELR